MHLLIVRPGAIGDTLLTFPILKELREQYRGCTITFVGNTVVLPLARSVGLADEVWDYDSLMWSELFSPRGIHSHQLKEVLQRIDYAICWLHDADGMVRRNLLEQRIARIVVAPGRPSDESNVHIVTYLAETLGMADNLAHFEHFELAYATIGDMAAGSRRPFAIHAGSGGAWKCWPISHFAAIVRELWARSIPVLLLAGPADEARITALLRLIGNPSEGALLTLLVHAPFTDVASYLQSCRGYLGNDSGITHLAALLGVPTIALFGRSNSLVWHPIGPRVQLVQEFELASLKVDTVWAYLERVLEA